jgi:hypothetical protein
MIVEFVYCLHDDQDQEGRCEAIMQNASEPLVIDDELAEKIGRPFYEVMLTCELDTETGAVTISHVAKTGAS